MYIKNPFLFNLQALRGIAFLGVMVSHTGIALFNGTGAWGVSIFFIISGFVLVYNYYKKNRIKNCSVINNLFFAYSKLKRLFFLHVLCTVSMLVFYLLANATESISFVTVLRIILNFLFLQEWIPLEERSINAVSWFCCTILFGYFLFPWFLKRIENCYSVNKALINIFVCIVIEFIFGIISSSFSPEVYKENEIWAYNIPVWLAQTFPLARVWDMVIGFNLAYIFLNQKKETSPHHVTSWEIIGILVSFLCCYCFAIMVPSSNSIRCSSPERWWTFSLLFILPSVILIYTFALQCGKVSSFLCNKFFLYLAELSPYGFLIHWVVFKYLSAILHKLFKYQDVNSAWGGVLSVDSRHRSFFII